MPTLTRTHEVAAVEVARALMVLAERSPDYVDRFEELDELLELILPNTAPRARAVALRDVATWISGRQKIERITLAGVQKHYGLDAIEALPWLQEIHSHVEGCAWEAETRALTAALADRGAA